MSEADDERVVPIEAAKRRQKARAVGVRETRSASDTILDEIRKLPANDPVLDGMEAGGWLPAEHGLPPHCPVRPLGYDGDNFMVLTGRCTVMGLPTKAGKGDIDAAFTPFKHYPVWSHPRKVKRGKEWHVYGNYEAERVRLDLFAACADCGPWMSADRQRDVGAWADESGRLILHLGDCILTPDGEFRPGVIGDHVYPAGEAAPRPGAFEASSVGGCGSQLLEHFKTWNWMRGDIDALFVLGWLTVAPLGGVFRWRPYVYVSGDAGTGKTTLIDLIEFALNGLLLRAEDATEAGVAQTIGHSTRPVLLDEQENEIDNNRAAQMIRLARLAASGGQRRRGGADHKAHAFSIRNTFIFSGINMPPLDASDLSRMAMLALRPFERGTPRRRFDAAEIAALGQALYGRAVAWFAPDPEDQGLPRFEALLERVRERLIVDLGHDDRGADTFGYLMAGAWMALHDDLPEADELKAFVSDDLHRSKVAEYEGIKPNWQKCADFMLNRAPRVLERNTNKSVRAILEAWRDGDLDEKPVKIQLGAVGLTVHWRKGAARNYENARLFVPNAHPEVAEMFFKSKWKTLDPAGEGGWKNALRGGPSWIQSAKVRNGTKIPVWGTSLSVPELTGYPIGSDQRDEKDFEA